MLEDSVEDGISDFRSITYSLANQEEAKQRAAAEAMPCAMGRAKATLEEKGQKIGALRFANLDVKQLVGVSDMNIYSVGHYGIGSVAESVSVSGGGWGAKKVAPPPPLPMPQPKRITVSATVQCAFQIL